MNERIAIIWCLAALNAGFGFIAGFRSSTVGIGRLATVGLAMFSVMSIVMRFPGGNFDMFGRMHLVYAHIVFAIPALSVALLALPRFYPNRFNQDLMTSVRAFCWGSLLLVPLGIYVSFIEPHNLTTERASVNIPVERNGGSDITVAVLADIQTRDVGSYERRAVERAMSFAPDIIVLPGDVFQQDSDHPLKRELPELREILGRLSAPGGVWVVPGDSDTTEELHQIFDGTNVRVLVNQVQTVTVKDRTVLIGGIELDYDSPDAVATIDELQDRPGDELRLLVAHRPDVGLDLTRNTRIDLVVAGHTHGGQVRLPVIGPVMTLSEVPNDVAGGGLHDLGNGRRIYVSRGVGMERGQAPPMRFLCPPELSLLTLAEAGPGG